MSPVPVLLISRIVKFFTQLSDQREQASVVRAVTRIWMWPRRPVTLASILVVGIAAGARSADSVDWNRRAEEDAQRDFTTIIFDGQAPHQLACDTTVRPMSDGSWVTVMLGGGHTEPLPANRVFISRSQDQGKTWTPMCPIDLGIKSRDPSRAITLSELMLNGPTCQHGLAGSQRRVWRVEDVFRPQRRFVPHLVGIGASAGQAGGSNDDPQRDQDPRWTDSHALSALPSL